MYIALKLSIIASKMKALSYTLIIQPTYNYEPTKEKTIFYPTV